LLQRAALEELEREEDLAVLVDGELVDGRDAGVLELPGDLRLLHEAREVLGAARDVREDDLDRDPAAQAPVEREGDAAHAALADLALDQVLSLGLARGEGDGAL